MAEKPYSNREIDRAIESVKFQISEIMQRSTPFEKDMRESLSRVETDLSNIQTHIEDRINEEREKSDKSYAPIIMWTGLLALLGIWASLEVPQILKLLHLISV